MSDTKMHTGLTAVAPALPPVRPKARWRKEALPNFDAVVELLGALERRGVRELRVTVGEDAYVVRWR